MANVTGTFTGTGQSAAFHPMVADLPYASFNMSLWGTFAGTVQLERSFDGATWLPLTERGSSITFTGPCSEIFEEPEPSAQYRLNCTSYTSGTINYRLSQ